MRISRTYGVRAVAAAGLIGGAMLIPAAASASTAAPTAAPGHCSTGTSAQRMYGLCTTGTGKYYIHGWCVKVDDPSQHFVQNGNTVSVGTKSWTACPVATYPEPLSVVKV
jgi:hypothetical protein